MQLSGKRIIVVGAGGRIGQEIVGAALEAGARVSAVDHSATALASLQGRFGDRAEFHAQAGDITSLTSVSEVLLTASQRFGGVDGSVNAAYPRNANYGRAFLDVTYEDFCANVSAHLGGYFLFMQQCARYAIERNIPFSLVNFSSIYGVVAPRFEIYAGTTMTMPVEYAAIKSGLQHLTRYATVYARGTAFRANCVSPGGILEGQDPRFLERYSHHCQRKGMLEPEDVIPTVLFLLSDASAYIAGQNIIVDDGFTL